MHIRVAKKTTLFAVIAVALAACNANPLLSATKSPPTPQPTPTTSPSADLCANPLAPVAVGATWTYQISTGTGSPAAFTTTITDVRKDGFSTSTQVEGESVGQEWACKPEGIVALSLGAGQAALDLSIPGLKADLSVSNPTGVTLPSKVEPGTQWPYGLDLAGSLAQGALAAKASGNVATAFKAVGTESVTVPAGTFDAMRVEGISTFNMSADFHGLKLPVTSVVNLTLWFAPGVGLIKVAETGELAGTALDTTTELQSYNIP